MKRGGKHFRREIALTTGPGILLIGMKSRELDIDYLFLLEALDEGVVPGEESVAALERMGLVERTPEGLALTMDAQVKLANLRSLLRDNGFSSS
jgi:hypothetical protein